MSKSKDHWKDIGEDHPADRPAPFAQDTSREPPTKEQREKDYEGGKKPD